MTFLRAPLAWLGGRHDPIAAALTLATELKADIAALRTALAEARSAVVALRQVWSRASPPSRSSAPPDLR